ncbi:DUF3331 domain-containing protein [Paraburkholderia tropica]|uniref:DUF3331 domain-containing protein n=1 Tax=Paraburkholderia tropica TaxID=92647 RepID=UPI00399D0E14
MTGYYGAQIWKQGKARSLAVCVLSGASIRRGDAVYRPMTRGNAPLNHNWMMLVSAVLDLENGVAPVIPDTASH